MGRSTKSGTAGNDDIHINVLLSAGEYLAIRDAAERMAMSMTAFMRQAAREKLLLEGKYHLKMTNGEFVQVRGLA